MRRKADFCAAAGSPAKARVAFRKVSGRVGRQAAISEARGAEDQHIADGDAGAAANGAEPGIGELPRRKSIAGRGQIDVGLAAVDEIAMLPIEAGLDAARGPRSE